MPTTLGANITEVWYWVMTKLAPIAPMQQAEEQEALVALARGDAQHRKGADQQQAGVGLARAVAVAHRADHEAHEDRHGDRRDVDVGDLVAW